MADTGSEHIVLTGAMGTGKTTIGRRLSRRLHMPFLDSDEQLEATVGMSGRAYAQAHGVPALHRVEVDMLLRALARPQPTVIAAAASVADSQIALQALAGADATLFVLDAPLEVLASRIDAGTHRRDVSLADLQASIHRRNRALQALEPADVVDTGQLSVEETVDRLVSLLPTA